MFTSLTNKVIDTAFAMLVLRMLGPDNVGKYVFATVIYAYFEILTNFGLTTLAQREVAKDRGLSNLYMSNSLIVRLSLTILAAPFIAVFLYTWRGLFGLEVDTAFAVVLLALALVPGNISAALSSIFLAHEKMEYPALVTVASTVLKVVFGAAALLAGWSIVGLAGVALVVNIITAVIFIALIANVLPRPRIEVDGKLSSWMLRTSWPLMINQFLATMFFRTDTFILESARGSKELGYYGTAYKFIDGLNIIPSTFTIALFPVLSRFADSSSDAFIRAYGLALRLLLILSIPIAVGTAFLAEPIILLFGGPEYVPHSVLALQVLIWFLPFSYVNSLTQYVLIAINQQRFITISFITATSFNIVANLLLIPRFGFVGAGAVTIISEIVLLLPFLYAVFRYLGPVSILGSAIRPIISSGLMALVLWQIRSSDAPVLLLVSIATYCIGLVLLRTFTSDDVQIARKLLSRQEAS
jgi:O-antigen/teichoic acid export membrane protein